MSKTTVRGGHNFKATGAAALINEVVEDRKVKDAVIKYLRILGHEVLDVTAENLDKNSDLAYGVNKANNWGADLFISIHFNKRYDSYNGTIGTESWIYKNNSTKNISDRICKNLSSLGFKNRGTKYNPNLYELSRTKMPAIIVEVCFVEATKDVELYKKIGPDKIGQAIAEAIADKKVPSEVPENKDELYRVRKTWADAKSQIGAFKNLEAAKDLANKNPGYNVFNSAGVNVYSSGKNFIVGATVKIIGSKYATGQIIPNWVKQNTYKIKELRGDKALITDINSLVYLKDLQLK